MKFVEASPAGQFVVSSFPFILDFDIRIWTRSLELVAVFGGHKCFVNRVSWSPNGKYLASCGEDHRVLIWAFSGDVTDGFGCDVRYKRKFNSAPLSVEWTDNSSLFVLQTEKLTRLKFYAPYITQSAKSTTALLDEVELFSNTVYCSHSKKLYVWSVKSIIRVDPATMNYEYLLTTLDHDGLEFISSVSPISKSSFAVAGGLYIFIIRTDKNESKIVQTFDFDTEVFRISVNPDSTCIIVNFLPMSTPSCIVHLQNYKVFKNTPQNIDHAGDFSWMDKNHVVFDYGNSLQIVEFKIREWKLEDEIYFTDNKINKLNLIRTLVDDKESYISYLPEDCFFLVSKYLMGVRIDYTSSDSIAFC
jgi:WD40 repeat protein